MAEILGITNARAEEIRNASITSAWLSTGGDLIMGTPAGAQYNLGPVTQARVPVVEALISLAAFDKTAETVVVPDWLTAGIQNVKLTNPATVPTGTAKGVAWSPDGRYVAVGHAGSPFITVYKRNGDTFTKLTNPSTLPAASVDALEWSPNGQYLAMGVAGSTRAFVYKRSGDTLTMLGALPSLPGAVNSVSWTSDGNYLAYAHAAAPYMTVYKRTGDTFAKLATPSIAPTSEGMSVAWASNGTHLAVSMLNSPYFRLWKRTGDTLTALALPSAPIMDEPWTVSWSPNGKYVTVSNYADGLALYERTGDTLTRKVDAFEALGNSPLSNPFSPDGRYVAVTENAIYRFDEGDPVRVAGVYASFPPVQATSITWSPDGLHLVMGLEESPFIAFYRSQMGPVPGAAIARTITP